MKIDISLRLGKSGKWSSEHYYLVFWGTNSKKPFGILYHNKNSKWMFPDWFGWNYEMETTNVFQFFKIWRFYFFKYNKPPFVSVEVNL